MKKSGRFDEILRKLKSLPEEHARQLARKAIEEWSPVEPGRKEESL